MNLIAEIIIPKDNADEEVLISELHYQNNDKVGEFTAVIDVETSKTSIELEAPSAGYIEYLVKQGDTAVIGQVVAKIYDEEVLESLKLEPDADSENSSKSDNINSKVVTKDAQILIDEHSIDVSLIKSNFVKKEDVELYISKLDQPNVGEADTDNVNKISRLKSLEIKALSSVQSAGLVSTLFINIDVDKRSEDLQKPFSFLPIIAFECAIALESFPILNAYFDDEKIINYDSVNIGIALDVNDGLKVFTLQNTNKKSIDEVEALINEGLYKYLRKDLTPSDLSNSTFTISDLSQYGVERFIPLVNNKQAAILGVSSLDLKLKRFNLSLAFDHRVTEGRVASEFLALLKERIELSI
jgi:pyruvate/2-oxoglutarate dehydrogenase complex dihydrolipoamide acyltransferase (E2) component